MGRDLSLGNLFRPPVIECSDRSIGVELIKIVKEQLEMKWITTPGHTACSCSMLIKGPNVTFNGEPIDHIALVGDLWDCEDDNDFWRDMSEDHATQITSRNYIGSTVKPSLIIPGHGPPFSGPYQSY